MRRPLVLDAYIIEKIKREQEQRDSNRAPLQKEPARPPSRRSPDRSDRWHDQDQSSPERGVVIIDM